MLPHKGEVSFNPLNAELNPICHLLALIGDYHIFHISGFRVNVNDTLVDVSRVSCSCYILSSSTAKFHDTDTWNQHLW